MVHLLVNNFIVKRIYFNIEMAARLCTGFIERKPNLMQHLSSVYFAKYLYMFRAYLEPIIRRYNRMDTTIGTYCSF
jgi:hypothetical protein